MPGTVMFHHGKIVASYRSRDAADKPDYVEFAAGKLA
jgi:hypothetical protein